MMVKGKLTSALLAVGLAASVGVIGAGAAEARTFSYGGASCSADELASAANQATVTNKTCHRVVARIVYRAANGTATTVTGTTSSTKSVATAPNSNIVSRGANVDFGNGTMSGWHNF